MAEIVAQKFWVKVSRKEIEAIIRTIVPDEMCDFDLIEVQFTKEDHLIDEVTFGLSYNVPTGPSADGPLRCGECGRDDFVDEDAVTEHEEHCDGIPF